MSQTSGNVDKSLTIKTEPETYDNEMEDDIHASFVLPYEESETESEGKESDVTDIPEETSVLEYDDGSEAEDETSLWVQCLTTAGLNLYQSLAFVLGPTVADHVLEAINYYQHFFSETSDEPPQSSRVKSRSSSRASSVTGSPRSKSLAFTAHSRTTFKRSNSTLQ